MPMSRMNVPIVGATGSIGNLVVEEALREGHTANRNRQLSDHSVPFS